MNGCHVDANTATFFGHVRTNFVKQVFGKVANLQQNVSRWKCVKQSVCFDYGCFVKACSYITNLLATTADVIMRVYWRVGCMENWKDVTLKGCVKESVLTLMF